MQDFSDHLVSLNLPLHAHVHLPTLLSAMPISQNLNQQLMYRTLPYIFSFSVLIHSDVCHNTVEIQLHYCFHFIVTLKLHDEKSLCRGLT